MSVLSHSAKLLVLAATVLSMSPESFASPITGSDSECKLLIEYGRDSMRGTLAPQGPVNDFIQRAEALSGADLNATYTNCAEVVRRKEQIVAPVLYAELYIEDAIKSVSPNISISHAERRESLEKALQSIRHAQDSSRFSTLISAPLLASLEPRYDAIERAIESAAERFNKNLFTFNLQGKEEKRRATNELRFALRELRTIKRLTNVTEDLTMIDNLIR